jgi:hypothetical protein
LQVGTSGDGMADVYSRYIDPADSQAWGKTSTGYLNSGIFAMHITYPDTEYGDGIEDWETAVNSTDWRQGVTLLIRTPLASSSSTITEAKNVIAIDLKQAKADHNSSDYTYDLGTEEAARFIAAKINSRRIKMQGERDLTKYLRARYVRQSLPKYQVVGATWQGENGGNTSLDLEIASYNRNGFPSELAVESLLRVENNTGTKYLTNGDYALTDLRWKKQSVTSASTNSLVRVTINQTSLGNGNPSNGDTLTNDFTLIGEEDKHSILITWELNEPSTNAGYWSASNGGPVVQGMGSIGLHRLVAKPMDGGNMGLPALNYDSRSGITAQKHTSNHGYNRFSIEGLNSTNMPNIPPPDFHQTLPTIHGITSLHPDTESDLTSNNRLRIQELEYGTELFVKDAHSSVNFENGYSQPFTIDFTNTYVPTGSNGIHLSKVESNSIPIKHGLNDSSENAYARPFRTTSKVNDRRVTGLQISNEERVFETMTVVDDLGNELTLEGGSPLGTIIRDYDVSNTREDANGELVVGPSAPNGKLEPNMRIQLPNQEDIPGGIFVRSGHDRIQAWSNQTWGMGGLSAPNPREAGVAESDSDEASQFDTHDRTLIFHCERILHDKLETIYGLDLSVKPGAVPSGSTRLFASHRATDHCERGSLLKQTDNGTDTGNFFPHHRLRFGRQGHSFVMPLCHRGTPSFMRRQLHRSHGSAYSLMFEAETEYKHHGFGDGETTNTSTKYQFDTIDKKDDSSYLYSTGSFVSDGIPLSEIEGLRMIDADGAYTSATHRSIPDYIFAPGQKHTNVEASSEHISFATTGVTTAVSTGGATHLDLVTAMTANNRFNTANEFMINGFFINGYLGVGGRPEPIRRTGSDSGGNWFVRGYHEGVIRPRVATELATVPPLLHHDPELLNMAGVPISTSATVPSTAFDTADTQYIDLALTKARDTSTGATPDAFLCHWLAEYSHPSLFGTSREHFMSFRYRESGMPRSINYPSTRGLLLRNFSSDGYYDASNEPKKAEAFERLYVAQWLQNYGYNGLNASGHGDIDGLRSLGAVLMGHTTIREPSGTIQLYNQSGTRKSRGEGIGDSVNPSISLGIVNGIDKDSDDEDVNKQYFVFNPSVAIDISRRLPIRAWGFRTASNASNMLAGDPTEASSGNTYAMTESGRFDGGVHDSMSDLPITGNNAFIFDMNFEADHGIERSIPVGFVANDFTTEAHLYERNVRQNNSPIREQDKQIGIGNSLGITQNGMLSPLAMSAGAFDYESDDIRPTELPVSQPVLWLKADAIDQEDGSVVSEWTDSSANKFVFEQATASRQPVFTKKHSAVNNMPVVEFDGTDYMQLQSGFEAKLNTKDVTLFVVVFPDSDNNAAQGVLESFSNSPVTRSGHSLWIRMDQNNRFRWQGGADTTYTGINASNDSAEGGVARIATGKIYGGNGTGGTATFELYLDGYQEGTTTGPWWFATADPYGVGHVGSFKLTGKIAEIIQYDRKLSTDEQYEVEAYLSRKYAIDISDSANSAHTGRLRELDYRPVNKGTDPFIDLIQRSGSPNYAQEDSASAMITTSGNRFSHTSDFYHLRGNALHTNQHAIAETIYSTKASYPPNSISAALHNAAKISPYEVKPMVINEITDIRQIQSDTQPRLGLIMEVESERNDNKSVDYAVVGTRSASLHTDLMLGYQFPVLPSHTTKTYWATSGFSTDGTGSASTKPDFTKKPTWSPDSNASKGAVGSVTGFANDSTRSDFKTHALDAWAVRGSADLPAWGGVYILRKTYLNRSEDENTLRTEVDGNTGKATASHPSRKYVDYVVRPVRPLKLFGFASDLMQDGWVNGPRCSITVQTARDQPFDRDKRYGVFEMNYDRGENEVEPITSAGTAFTMEYPNANEYDVVYHLIPTANMLQFFKSDAHRIDNSGNYNSKIEARYSQSSVPGGGEPVSQSETRYEESTGVMGDHARQIKKGIVKQSEQALRIYPKVKIIQSKGSGVYSVDDASVLPATGKLFALEHTGVLTYTSIDGDDVTTTGTLTDSAGNTVTDYTGIELYFTDLSTVTGDITEARSPLARYAISPSFVDNTVVASKIVSQSWYYYNAELDAVNKTPLNYRGLLHYEPSDFIMTSQQPFVLSDGNDRGIIRNVNGRQTIKTDGRNISDTFAPPYIIDSNNIKWRVASVIKEQENLIMEFKEMSGKTLLDSGLEIGKVLAGQTGFIGMRTTDAALHLLNDAGGKIAGITITPTDDFNSNVNEVMNYLGAHPMLKQINDHSTTYVSRDTRGLNTMEVVRNLSQLDGRQIINERNGIIVYSNDVFSDKGLRIGVESGVESVSVSKLFDSPNEIVIVGDVIGGNEIVFIRVQDSEKIRQVTGDGEEGLVKTLRQQIPGVKNVAEARKLAKALLARAENGAPMIHLQGLMNATSISAGDIIDVNLPTQGVIGKFAVFEARHNYHNLKTDLTIAQYEKGIEGVLADIKTSTVTTSGIDQNAGDADIKNNLSLSSSIKLISVHRITVRNVNQTGFIIGAKHQNGLGKIGVRDDNKRAYPIGVSKSKRFVVK